MDRHFVKTAVVALALGSACGPAAAADGASAGARLAGAVGHWIAVQGSSALREIRDDVRKHLPEALKPRLPAPPPPAPAAATAPR